MNRVAILQSNYVPWKGYFDIIRSVDVFVIYDEVQFTKNDWRNRNIIKTNRGKEWLTIPVRNEGLHQKIYETRIMQSNWNVKHWNTLMANYGKASQFRNVREQFESLYRDITSNNLSEINLYFIKNINAFLGIETQIIDSRSLGLTGDKSGKLLDACKKLNANVYLSGPAAKDYLDEQIFRDENIRVEWMDYGGYPSYPQLHGDFEHGVSILDMIFNLGKDTVKYMKTIG